MASRISHVTRRNVWAAQAASGVCSQICGVRSGQCQAHMASFPSRSLEALANLHVAHSSWDHTLSLPR